MPRISAPGLKRIAIIAGLWTVFGLLWSAPILLDAPSGREGVELLESANHIVPFYWAWALLTPAVLWLARRAGRHELGDWRLWAIVIAGIPVAVVIHGLVYLLFLHVLGIAHGAFDAARMAQHIRSHGGGDAATYLTLVGISLLVQANLRVREREVASAALESRLARADLELMRWRLHPHFLFNALNTVSTLVLRGDQHGADRAINLIARYLRGALAQRADALVSLEDEIDAVARYVEIEALRFGEGTGVRLDVPVELRAARIPGSILQPLVENAFRHGGGPISLEASTTDGRLRITLSDGGTGEMSGEVAATRDGAGFGLAYVGERLRQFYGADATLVRSTSADGGLVMLDLPLSREP